MNELSDHEQGGIETLPLEEGGASQPPPTEGDEDDGEIFLDATSNISEMPEMEESFEEPDEYPDVTVHHVLAEPAPTIEQQEAISPTPAVEEEPNRRDWIDDINR